LDSDKKEEKKGGREDVEGPARMKQAERWRLAPGGFFVRQWKRLVSKNRDGYIFNYLKYHSLCALARLGSPKFLN